MSAYTSRIKALIDNFDLNLASNLFDEINDQIESGNEPLSKEDDKYYIITLMDMIHSAGIKRGLEVLVKSLSKGELKAFVSGLDDGLLPDLLDGLNESLIKNLLD